MEILLTKEAFAEFAKSLLARYFIVFRDCDQEESHYDINGDYTALASEVFSDDNAKIILYKRKGDYSDWFSDENSGCSEDFKWWISKDVGVLYTMDRTGDGEPLIWIDDYLHEGIDISDFLPDDVTCET